MKRTVKKAVMTAAAGFAAVALAACGAGGSTTSSSAASSTSTSSTSTSSTSASSSATGSAEETVYKVGIVQYVDDASLNQIESNIEARLDELGEENGVVFDYEDYTFNGQADGTVLNQIASELVADQVDIIIPIATPAAQVMQAATDKEDIPIVFAAVSDPVTAKLVESMDAPGGNITGTSDALNTEAMMNLILAQNPDVSSVGLLYSKSEDSSTKPIEEAKAFLDEKNISYVEKTGTTNDEISSAADALIAEGVDAIFTPTDNTVMTAELSIYEKLAEAGIPHYAGADSFALNGAFIGYGVDYANIGVETANMAADILVNGKQPSEEPVKTFDNGIAVINTDICAELGLDLDAVKEAIAPFCSEIQETQTAKEF